MVVPDEMPLNTNYPDSKPARPNRKPMERKPKPDFTIMDVALTEDYREGLIDIAWCTKSAGFGHLSFNNKNGTIYCGNEDMSREFVKEVLCKLVDKSIFENEEVSK